LKRFIVSAVVAGVTAVASAAGPRRSVTEKIEWTYTDRPEKTVDGLPNLLMVGDSITRAYYPAVAKELEGKANVYYFATSCSVGDVRLRPQIAEYYKMIGVKFDAVHFNNGMHGWRYTEEEYRRYFPELIAAVKAGAPKAKLVWATVTPVRVDKDGGATNARIDARNRIAGEFVAKAGIPTDDQHKLMLAHQELHSDDVHYSAVGSEMQGKQVAESVEKLLSK